MTQPIVISLPAPIQTAEVVAAPAHLAGASETRLGGPAGGNANARPPSAEAVHAAAAAALTEERAKVEEERRHLAEAHKALEKAAAAIHTLEAEALAGAEAQVVELALAIAGKVLMIEIEAGRFQMEPVVREAIRHVPSRRDIVVHLNPQDAAAWQQGGAAGAPASTLKVVADPAIRRGDCLVETAEATVSATVAERFQAVVNTLKAPN